MTTITSTLKKVKNHISRNKPAYAATTVAILAIMLQQRNAHDFYEFLSSKGIDPMEFYCPEYYEELNA